MNAETGMNDQSRPAQIKARVEAVNLTEDYDAVDLLIDTDPIELGRRHRAALRDLSFLLGQLEEAVGLLGEMTDGSGHEPLNPARPSTVCRACGFRREVSEWKPVPPISQEPK